MIYPIKVTDLAFTIRDIFNDIPRECIASSINMILREESNPRRRNSKPRQLLISILQRQRDVNDG